jgi:hypothetical protein
MRYIRIFAFLAVASVATGCLRISYTLNLKPDGTGSITKVIAVSKQGAGMMGGGTAILPTEAKLREEAAAMGPGVKFVSATPHKDGAFEGITAVYSFDDVTKLAVNMEQAVTGSVNMPGTDPDDKPDPDADVRLTFTREAGTSVLIMKMPDVPEPDEDSKKQAEQVAANPALEGIIKQMLAGLRMEVAVNIDGKIVDTNAPYVEGSRVVLLRLDGDELIKSGNAGAIMSQVSSGADPKAMLAKVPGLKVVLLPEVRITFR